MIIQCKMCGGDLKLTDGSSIAKCEYCGTQQTVPVSDTNSSKKINLFERANKQRFECNFDKAETIYEQIIAEYPDEAEAYWGGLLCKYGIDYVDDPKTGNKVPTCHRLSFDRVQNDAYYNKALELSDEKAYAIYESEGEQIEKIRNKIIEVSGKEDPYDVFICYKESDENNNRTEDSVLAEKLYDSLTAKNYRVFFSKITLEDKIGEEYEPIIFAALNSAKVMLVIGTDSKNLNSTWVRNEWSRYLDIIKQSKDKILIPCYKDMDPYDLPNEFSGLQAQDMGKVGAIEDLIRGIGKVIPRGTQAVGITEDTLKNVLKKESKKRTIKNVVVFTLVGIVVAVGGFFGIKALIKMIQDNKQTIVNENYYGETSATTQNTPTPEPTPMPTPLSIANLKPCTVWLNDGEWFTATFDVVGEEGEEYRISQLLEYQGYDDEHYEAYIEDEETGNTYITVVAGDHFNATNGESPSSGGIWFREDGSSKLRSGIYKFTVLDYDTGRVLASKEYRIK